MLIHLMKVGLRHLSNYSTSSGVHNYVYNGGERSFLFLIPTKILNFYKEFKPDMFVIEVPDTDKVDVEIPSVSLVHILTSKKIIVPIYPARQRVLIHKIGKKENSTVGPNRKSMSQARMC